jgi:hypothetical protein
MKTILLSSLLLLTACGGVPTRDYQASSDCIAQGHKPGTKEYDACMSEEATARAIKQQRDDYERNKRDMEMWKQRRY